MIKFSVSRVEKEAVFLEGNEPPSFWALPENDTYTPVRSVSYELTVKSAAGSIIVTGQVSGSVSATCGRCLAPLEMAISNSSIELYYAKNEITDEAKLKKAMYVMIIAYRSGYLKSEMEKGLRIILEEFGA